MTAQSSIPLKWYVPFANGDSSRVELPVTTSDPTRASQTLGFPPLTMQPPESGGVPPQGEDFNGGMNQVARIAWWVLNGGGWPFDATFAANSNINGYPNGATLQAADFRGDWINTADNNQNNPDTNGTNWVPGFQYGVTALTGLTGGMVTPTPAQAAKNSITLAGTLGSALTVILPTWTKNWTITNNTTGAFVTIVKTAAGSGVTIPQDSSPTRVSGDGTNIVQSPENIATGTNAAHAARVDQAGFPNVAVYALIAGVQNVSINGAAFTTTGASSFTIPPSGRYLGEAQAGGGGSGGTNGAGSASLGGGGGGHHEALITGATPGATVAIVVGAGGTAGAGGTTPTNGGTGGTSSIGSTLIAATGGAGGTAANGGVATGNAAGGTATGTAVGISTPGGNSSGVLTLPSSTFGTSAGGMSRRGAWQNFGPANVTTAGAAGLNYGGGASGALIGGAGAKGGDGLVVIRY